MKEEKTTPLRERMMEDMRIRGMGDKAQKSHIRAIKDFAAFLCHSPDNATAEELRAYQLHMTDTGVTPSTFNTRIVALRFFFGITCGREDMKRFAADPKRMGAKVGLTSVLHTWGPALTHHPHIHMIVPGGGLSPDGTKWVACKPGFLLHVRVLSRLFRRLFLDGLMALHRAGELAFFGDQDHLARMDAFAAWLAPFRKSEWVVHSKPPFGGPEAVLAYLSRYTHRVAISNHRLVSADADTVAFLWKDYRVKDGDRQKVMRLATPEFIRRVLIHVLPEGFHRIRHYGLLASGVRKTNLAKIRASLGVQPLEQAATLEAGAEIIPLTLREPCPCCGGPMRIIEIFRRGQKPRSRAPPRDQVA